METTRSHTCRWRSCHTGSRTSQTDDEHARTNKACLHTLWSARAPGQGPAWKHGQLLDSLPKVDQGKGTGAMPTALAKFALHRKNSFLNKWRDRRECVSEPPLSRNPRETDLVASVIKAAPYFDEFIWLSCVCLHVLLQVVPFCCANPYHL